jgi:predicted nucleic acid-binding Zn ribbon protein
MRTRENISYYPDVFALFNPRVFYQDIIAEIMRESERDGELKRNDSIKLGLVHIQASDNDTDSICPVCQVKIEKGDTVCKPVCSHIVHRDCLSEWVKYKQECPMCRKAIPVLEE